MVKDRERRGKRGQGSKKVVIKLTGSLFSPGFKASELMPYVRLIEGLAKEGLQQAIVVGGGALARLYIDQARELGVDEGALDELGILASRLNARWLIAALGSLAHPKVPITLEEVGELHSLGKVVVLGGLQPGHSTNAVAALVAERIRADLLINATDVEGVYTKDPKADRRARLLRRVSVKDLSGKLLGGRMEAGSYQLMDAVALKIIERSRIPTRIVRCTPDNIRGVIEGKELGTLIAPS